MKKRRCRRNPKRRSRTVQAKPWWDRYIVYAVGTLIVGIGLIAMGWRFATADEIPLRMGRVLAGKAVHDRGELALTLGAIASIVAITYIGAWLVGDLKRRLQRANTSARKSGLR